MLWALRRWLLEQVPQCPGEGMHQDLLRQADDHIRLTRPEYLQAKPVRRESISLLNAATHQRDHLRCWKIQSIWSSMRYRVEVAHLVAKEGRKQGVWDRSTLWLRILNDEGNISKLDYFPPSRWGLFVIMRALHCSSRTLLCENLPPKSWCLSVRWSLFNL